jgi:hypothetical protein
MSGEDAAYELNIDLPNLPKGELVQIAGLGTFENGSSYTITKSEADSYRSYHSRVVPVTGDNDEVLGSDLELGSTLLQASKYMYGVTVETSKPSQGEQRSTPTSTPSDAGTQTPASAPSETDQNNDGGESQ